MYAFGRKTFSVWNRRKSHENRRKSSAQTIITQERAHFCMQLFICACVCAPFFRPWSQLRRSAIQIRKLSFIFISNDVCSAMSFPVFCVLVIDSFRFQFCLPLAIVKYPIVIKVKAVLLIKLHVQRCLTREHRIALFLSRCRHAHAQHQQTHKIKLLFDYFTTIYVVINGCINTFCMQCTLHCAHKDTHKFRLQNIEKCKTVAFN